MKGKGYKTLNISNKILNYLNDYNRFIHEYEKREGNYIIIFSECYDKYASCTNTIRIINHDHNRYIESNEYKVSKKKQETYYVCSLASLTKNMTNKERLSQIFYSYDKDMRLTVERKTLFSDQGTESFIRRYIYNENDKLIQYIESYDDKNSKATHSNVLEIEYLQGYEREFYYKTYKKIDEDGICFESNKNLLMYKDVWTLPLQNGNVKTIKEKSYITKKNREYTDYDITTYIENDNDNREVHIDSHHNAITITKSLVQHDEEIKSRTIYKVSKEIINEILREESE